VKCDIVQLDGRVPTIWLLQHSLG